MFQKMLDWLRQLFDRFAKNGETVVPDVLISSPMSGNIELWTRMYENNAPWLNDDTHSFGIPAAVASEFARLVTVEMRSTMSGSKRADYINSIYQDFLINIQRHVEYACAKGGAVFKPYISGNTVRVECVQADMFFPIEFDSSGNLTGAVFVEQITRKGRIYTRLELAQYADTTYSIKNKAFCSRTKDTLGTEVPLEDVAEWSDIQPETTIKNVEKPLFAYFRVPSANTVDAASPLGVSVYSRAVDLIEQADKVYSGLLWEFEGGEMAIDAAYDVLMTNPDGSPAMPKHKKRLFRSLNTSLQGKDFYQQFAPALRDGSYKNGLNIILRQIEFSCGLAYGTLSDVQTVEKTAEEVRASKERSYATVSNIQTALENALRQLIYAVDVLCTLYNLAPAGAIAQSYEWDDSLVADRRAEFAERMQLITACNEKPEYMLAWYYGITPEQAQERINSSTGDFWSGA